MIPPLLLEELRRPDAYPLVVTGAGISLASGIATFRGSDPNAVWSKNVLEKGTRFYFERDPVGSWSWYLSRFAGSRSAMPNPAHYALGGIERKLLERGAKFMLVTQNVDGLHLAAGSQNVVEIHGAARKVRCSSSPMVGCPNGEPEGFLLWDDAMFAAFREDPCKQNLPVCPMCGDLLRPHVLWFDESYSDHEDYGLDKLVPEVEKFTLMLFVGTSFSVGITDMLTQIGTEGGIAMFTVDPTAEGPDWFYKVPEKAEEFLPALAATL